MNCLQHLDLPGSSASLIQSFKSNSQMKPPPAFLNMLGTRNANDLPRHVSVKAISGSSSSAAEKSDPDAEEEKEKSEVYSTDMTEAMGAVLTYRHELGMNYNFILPDLIVGSCLRTPEDVDKLRKIGVKTIFCLQQDPDLVYFGVDISAIREYAKTCGDIQHLRAQIRDLDAFDLRIRLPAVVSKLYKAINQNGGIAYIHCTAGLGRAPAVAMAYMFWVQGYKLSDAYDLLLSKRSCYPKLEAVKSATADVRIPLVFDKKQGLWTLKRELLEGRYKYKYIIDGEWTFNNYELVTSPNKDGHVNNYVQVHNDAEDSVVAALQSRLTGDDPDLTGDERIKLRQFLEANPDDE